MSLASFALLIAAIGALAIFLVAAVLVVYFFKRIGFKNLGVGATDAEIDADADEFKKSKVSKFVLKPVARIAFGMFWGGLIVAGVAAIVGA